MNIVLKDIKIVYGNRVVLKNFSYSFKSGTIYSICGANGIGKTTLLKCIATLIEPTSGAIVVDGKSVNTYSEYRDYRRRLSILTKSDNCLIDDLNISQNIRFFLWLHNKSFSDFKQDIEKLIEGFELNDYLRTQVKKLSKGTKQKAALVVTLMRKTELILIDEPFDGLDSNSVLFLKNILFDYSKNAIIVFATPVSSNGITSEMVCLDLMQEK